MREYSREARKPKLINLDPAQESAAEYDIDLCDHITVDEVMESSDLGPNGALFCALEEMVQNLEELDLHELEDEYLIFDCPGQIELFLHSDILQRCVAHTKAFSRVALVYITDATNFATPDKFVYSALCATLCISRFYLPAINVATKVDLVSDEVLERILSREALEAPVQEDEYGKLRNAMLEYVNMNGMLDYIPLNWNDETLVSNLYSFIDQILQRYDDIEPVEHAAS